MQAHVINILIQFSSVNFEFLISDENGVIPPMRLSTQLPEDPLPDRASFVNIIKRVMLGQYLIEPDETIRDAMFAEYYRPEEEHVLVVDAPDTYPDLGG